MLFSSTVFLLIFLPLVLGIYYLLRGRRRLQNFFLLLASLLFYAWGKPENLLLLLFSILCNYGFGCLLGSLQKKRGPAKAVLWAAVAVNLGLLFAFKYSGFAADQLEGLGIRLSLPRLALPIGISFYTFQAMSYVIDVYRGKTPAQKNPLSLALYISLFPQLIAGPIVKYHSVADQINRRVESWEAFSGGVRRFLIGLCKKVLLANQLALIADAAFAAKLPTVSLAWLGAVCYSMQIYYDFSGYSDMAIGLGAMFGFRLAENFRHPYSARSDAEFWRRWHISLSEWFRDYVYIPLGGSRVNAKWKLLRNLLITWALTGFWHGANWTFLLWGLTHFVLLTLERLLHPEDRLPSFLRRVLTLFVVVLAWVLFRADNLAAAGQYLAAMFGRSNFFSPLTGFYLREYIVFLIPAVLFCAPVAPWLRGRLERSRYLRWLLPLSGAGLALLYVVVICYLVKGTYNPFIYFNF